MPPGKAIRALNHAYRQRILGVLEEGPITYSDLLSSLEPKGSERGRFNYHLRALREAGLVGVEESLYALSASGKAALRFLKELSENPHLPNRRRKPLTVVWSLLAVSVILSTAFLWVLYTGIPASDPNPEVRPGWGSPMLMAEGEEGDRQVLSWRIATESSGNGLVVWVQKEGNQSNLYASRFVPWTGWSSPAFIVTTSPTVENAYLGSLRISSDPQGNAIVLWTEKGARLFSSRYAPGLGWGPPELVYEGVGKTRISSVDLAMGPSGAAVAVWKSCRRDNGDWWGISFDCSVLSNRLEAENGWSSLAKINSDGVGRGVTEPVVGIDREGNAVAVWGQRGGEDQGGGLEEEKHWRLWANRYVFGTGWEGPAPLSGESNYVFGLDLSVSLSGHALAVWSQVDSDGASLNANRFSPVYGWGLPQEISPTPGSRPEAVIGFQGEALVAWEEWDVDGYDGDRLPMRLMARRLVPGVGWDPATVVWRFDSVSSYNPPCHAFGSDRAGNALIVWTDQGNRDTLDPPAVYASRFVPGTGWSSRELVGRGPNSLWLHGCPDIAMDPEGNALVVWGQISATETGDSWVFSSAIYANRYVAPSDPDEVLQDVRNALEFASSRLSTFEALLLVLMGLGLALLGLTVVLFVLYGNMKRRLADHSETHEKFREPPESGGG